MNFVLFKIGSFHCYAKHYLILLIVTDATHNPVVEVRWVKPINNWHI